MAKELYNQTIVAVDRTHRMASGLPGQIGCDNFAIESLAAEIGFKRRILTFTEADYIEYEPDRWEKVQEIIFKPGTATTIKVGTWDDPEYYIAETSDKLIPLNILMDDATVRNRQINFALNGSGTVIITSILY